jgi:hypothetical protein
MEAVGKVRSDSYASSGIALPRQLRPAPVNRSRLLSSSSVILKSADAVVPDRTDPFDAGLLLARHAA